MLNAQYAQYACLYGNKVKTTMRTFTWHYVANNSANLKSASASI